MNFRNAAVVGLAVLALSAASSACAKPGAPGSQSASGAGSSPAPKAPPYTVRSGVKIDSPTLKRAQARGKLVVGAKADQPFLGFEDASTGARSGFDIEIARMLAADLGFPADKVEFKTVDSANRETAISKGDVDLYIGTYTINDKRKKLVSFAGPYYRAGQDLLVAWDNTSITGPQSLKGKKVCSISGSTALERISDKKYGATVVALGKYSDCVKQLTDGQVDAVTTDDAVLKGYAAQMPARLKVVGKPFSSEPYGVGLAKGDKALRDALDDALTAHQDNGDWKKAYDATLGLSGTPAQAPPAIVRY
ncbi:glutamate ABC transporter substrate-binding protein [Streptomyces sp. CA-135486]|uniref:glutamate ABC transporter substrate-binding protein n=1 Tax=Streptomyces sp. CA-135486 TaxID=3240049 RepID=UPI003D91C1AE